MSRHPSYEIFEELGRGANTVVYRAYDLSLGRDVAVKELDETCRTDERRMQQFLQEAQFLAQFEHENISRVYTVEQEQGWIIMELMQGTLASLIAEGACDADLVRSILRQMLGALDFLHEKDKTHGTVRPTNLLINDRGRVKLSDFEQSDPRIELRAPTGSKKYLAPELIKPEFGPFGPSLDLYCLGFTALELLKGPRFDSSFPGTGEGAIDADMAWLRWHSSDEKFPPASKLVRDIPEDLAYVIDRMLVKQVNARPQSAREILNDLDDRPLVLVPMADADEEPADGEAHTGVTQVREIAPLAKNRVDSTESEAAAVPPRPRPANAKPKQAGNKRPFSKDWFNHHLGKPYILVPLCAVMLLGAVVVGLGLMPGRSATTADVVVEVPETPKPEPKPEPEAPKLVSVRFDVEPTADNLLVLEDEGELTPDEAGQYQLEPGAHQLTFQQEGYEPRSVEFTITPKENQFSVELTPIVTYVEMQIDAKPAGTVVLIDDQQQQQTGEGTITFDHVQGAPLTVSASKEGFEEFQQSYSADQLATADYRIEVELNKIPPPLPTSLVAKPESEIDPDLNLPARVFLADLQDVAPLELALVKPGQYRVGVFSDEKFAWELDGRVVTISQPFYIALHETTNTQYSAFYMEQGDEVAGTSWLDAAQTYANERGLDALENELPVVNVSFEQAEAFGKWAGGRLPSEEEWESAARGLDDQGYPFPWTGGGSVSAERCQIFRGGNPKPLPVAQLVEGTSPIGLTDLLGNVGEWCRVDEDGGIVKGCRFTTARTEYVRVTWRAKSKSAGGWDTGFRIIVPVNLDEKPATPTKVPSVLSDMGNLALDYFKNLSPSLLQLKGKPTKDAAADQ